MSPLLRLRLDRAAIVQTLVALGAVAAIVAAVVALATGRGVLAPGMEVLALVGVGALVRRYGIGLPGHGFASYLPGVAAYAVLDRGWHLAVIAAPLAMVVGDVVLRRLSLQAALGAPRTSLPERRSPASSTAGSAGRRGVTRCRRRISDTSSRSWRRSRCS